MSSSNSSSGGIGVLGLLGVVFVTLKLVGYIDWSWWYVTLPFWGGFAIAGVLFLIAGICKLIVYACESPQDRARRRAASALSSMALRMRR